MAEEPEFFGPTRDALEAWLDRVTRKTGGECYTDVIKFYLPTCRGKCRDAVNEFITKINKIFGGSTNYEATGCWIDEEGELLCEPVVVVESGHHCTKPHEAEEVGRALLTYAKKAGQRWLSVRQGKFYLFPYKPELIEE